MTVHFLMGVFFLYVAIAHFAMGTYRKNQKTNDKIVGLITILSLGLGLVLGLNLYFMVGIQAAISFGAGIGVSIWLGLIIIIGAQDQVYSMYEREAPPQDNNLHLGIGVGIVVAAILMALQSKQFWTLPVTIVIATLGYILGYKGIKKCMFIKQNK